MSARTWAALGRFGNPDEDGRFVLMTFRVLESLRDASPRTPESVVRQGPNSGRFKSVPIKLTIMGYIALRGFSESAFVLQYRIFNLLSKSYYPGELRGQLVEVFGTLCT